MCCRQKNDICRLSNPISYVRHIFAGGSARHRAGIHTHRIATPACRPPFVACLSPVCRPTHRSVTRLQPSFLDKFGTKIKAASTTIQAIQAESPSPYRGPVITTHAEPLRHRPQHLPQHVLAHTPTHQSKLRGRMFHAPAARRNVIVKSAVSCQLSAPFPITQSYKRTQEERIHLRNLPVRLRDPRAPAVGGMISSPR